MHGTHILMDTVSIKILLSVAFTFIVLALPACILYFSMGMDKKSPLRYVVLLSPVALALLHLAIIRLVPYYINGLDWTVEVPFWLLRGFLIFISAYCLIVQAQRLFSKGGWDMLRRGSIIVASALLLIYYLLYFNMAFISVYSASSKYLRVFIE